MKTLLLQAIPHRHKKGFSLVEILVSIAVIAVLVLLIVSGFQNSIERANRIACQGNLRQIGIATLLYRSDTGLNIRHVDTDSSWTTYWDTALLPYLENQKHFFQCPSDNVPRTQGKDLEERRSYSFNAEKSDPADPIPERKFILTDRHTVWNLLNSYGHNYLERSHYSNAAIFSSHSGGNNFLYFNGHVTWHQYGHLPQDSWTGSMK